MRLKKFLLVAYLSMAACAAGWWGMAADGWAGERIVRSLAQPRRQPADELRQPRYVERESHRGWQLRYDQFQVTASTTADDAQWAAGETRAAWETLGALADFWTRIHRRSNFAYASTMVAVDAPPIGATAGPRADMTLVGNQTLIRLELTDDADDDTLQDLAIDLRHATAHAFLHAAQMDQTLPPWACEGLARYVARIDAPAEAWQEAAERLEAPDWSRQRVAPDQLDDSPVELAEPADRVQFFLEGDDARHSQAFFAALERTMAAARPARSQQAAWHGPGTPAERRVRAPALEALLEETAESFARWQQDPLAGQPQLPTLTGQDQGLAARLQRMAFMLKLLDRFADQPRLHSGVKIQEFGQPAAAPAAAKPLADSGDLRRLYRQLVSSDQYWATLTPAGDVLLSVNEDHVREELADLLDPRYGAQHGAGGWRLSCQLPDGRHLHAQLEPAQGTNLRPQVRYELVAVPAATGK
ncbi:MAG: hypothetical protein J5I93_24260 [Pirellulaceae bacterium]|nr:hypothetical protein [Pirellulaceae bacterium]